MPGQAPQPSASPMATPAARKRSREPSVAADGPSSEPAVKKERIDDEKEDDGVSGSPHTPTSASSDAPSSPMIKIEVDEDDVLSGYVELRPPEAMPGWLSGEAVRQEWEAGREKWEAAWAGPFSDFVSLPYEPGPGGSLESWEDRMYHEMMEWYREHDAEAPGHGPAGARVDGGVDSGYCSEVSDGEGHGM